MGLFGKKVGNVVIRQREGLGFGARKRFLAPQLTGKSAENFRLHSARSRHLRATVQGPLGGEAGQVHLGTSSWAGICLPSWQQTCALLVVLIMNVLRTSTHDLDNSDEKWHK